LSRSLINAEHDPLTMSEEDDTYSTIFTALKHPIRRNILRRLSISSATYTELLNELGIENGLLNYHIESLHELIRKREDGTYTLSEFGLAGLNLIKRIEDPVPTQTDRYHRNRSLLLQALSVLLIIALSVSSWSFYSSNQVLKSELSNQQSQIETIQTNIQAYTSLFDSNITPPVSKIEAIAKALSSDGWNSTTLRGLVIEASLTYVRFFVADNGGIGFQFLNSVTKPMNDYSPKAEYNVTETGVYPPIKGTVWHRYVWTVIVHESGNFRGIPPPGLYWVDASTGELFKDTGIGIRAVPPFNPLTH